VETEIGDMTGAEMLAALRLQIDWGADEALGDAPVDRLRAQPPRVQPPRVQPPRIVAQTPSPEAAPAGIARPKAAAQPLTQAAQAATRAEQAAAASQDLTALREAVGGFDGCALRDTATSLVFAEGDPAAGLLLVGDAPNADEDRTGHPFAGASGAYLDRMLASIGLSRGQALLTPLIPWRPPGERPPSPAELAACLPFLWRLIALARPRRIVLFSALAARALLPAVQRRRPHGTWVALQVPGLAEPVPTLAAASLSAILQTPARRREAWADLRRLKRALQPPDAE
jgi:uracil-DNA glycosylase family 4